MFYDDLFYINKTNLFFTFYFNIVYFALFKIHFFGIRIAIFEFYTKFLKSLYLYYMVSVYNHFNPKINFHPYIEKTIWNHYLKNKNGKKKFTENSKNKFAEVSLRRTFSAPAK